MPRLTRTIAGIPAARLIIAAEVLLLAREHLQKLEPQERRRIVELVRRGRGRPRNLTDRERRELAALIGKIEPRAFVGSAAKRFVGFGKPGRSRGPS